MDCDVTIIGGGAVGCAIANVLSHKHKVMLVEKNGEVGQETSGRSGEVIHTGINYLDHPHKGARCMEGNRITYEWCDEHEVPYWKLGKIIVIREGEEEDATNLFQKGVAEGLELYLLDREGLEMMEPNVNGVGAIWSPNTGTVNSGKLVESYINKANESNLDVAYGNEVVRIDKINGGYSVFAKGQDEGIESEVVINAAGLQSDVIAKLCGIDDPSYELHYCKGNYLAVRVAQDKMLNHLIYPTPGPVSQGFHVKLVRDPEIPEVGTQMWIGPDARYIRREEFDYNPNLDFAVLQPLIYQYTQEYFPKLGIKLEDITPGYVGVRPKLQAQGEPSRDWIIREESDRGLPGLISLVGIDSPGLTSSMAIARHVQRKYFK